jgi:hypothetical protein
MNAATNPDAMNAATNPNPKAGDVWTCSWGYDQTNVDFFVVVKATDKSVWLQECGKTYDDKGKTVPAVANPKGPAQRRKLAKGWDGGHRARLSSFQWARPWSGRPLYETPFWAGH